MKAEMRAEMERMREHLTPKLPQEAVSDEQLAALQARLETLHVVKLLTDDEFFALEDMCADFAELQATIGAVGVVTKEIMFSAPAFEPAAKLHTLVVLPEKMATDAGFARQARWKFVP